MVHWGVGSKPIVSSASLAGEFEYPALLDRLCAADGDYVPLGELGSDVKRLRPDLEVLVSFGFGLEEHPYRGVAYRGPAERFCPDQIDTGWRRSESGAGSLSGIGSRAQRSGRPGRCLRSNDGLVILAEEPTAGRGRRGRSWTVPPVLRS